MCGTPHGVHERQGGGRVDSPPPAPCGALCTRWRCDRPGAARGRFRGTPCPCWAPGRIPAETRACTHANSRREHKPVERTCTQRQSDTGTAKHRRRHEHRRAHGRHGAHGTLRAGWGIAYAVGDDDVNTGVRQRQVLHVGDAVVQVARTQGAGLRHGDHHLALAARRSTYGRTGEARVSSTTTVHTLGRRGAHLKSMPTARPDSPTRAAAMRVSTPMPHPRSSTVSPSRYAANACGLPTPCAAPSVCAHEH